MAKLKKQDPKVYAAMVGELKRQQEGMELIASENYVSPAVLEALGSVFTNKLISGTSCFVANSFSGEINPGVSERSSMTSLPDEVVVLF